MEIGYYVGSDPLALQRTPEKPRPRVSLGTQVTFGEFAAEARRRGISANKIADMLAVDKLECASMIVYENRYDLARRIFNPDYARNVLPYRSLLAMYLGWMQPMRHKRTCACGCGHPIKGHPSKRWWSDACKKRAARDAGAESTSTTH